MTREDLFEKMKGLPNPSCRVNLIQQVWEIMNGETEELKKENAELKSELHRVSLNEQLAIKNGKIFLKQITELEQKNGILAKALNLYINWADECGIGWDNFPDMSEKWYKLVEEKGLGWIEGLTFMVMEEAKEQLRK